MSFDLPDWLSQQLEFDRDNDLQQGHVAEAMYHGDRPYYSLRHMRNELDNKFSRDTIRTRLDEMTEAGVLEKEPVNNGDIWWILYSETNYPKPPDVEVAAKPNEPTVSEFLSQPHILLAVLSIMAAAASGIIIWAGTLQSAGRISLPADTSWVLAIGLTVILASYLCIFISVILWVLQKATGGLKEEHSLRELLG